MNGRSPACRPRHRPALALLAMVPLVASAGEHPDGPRPVDATAGIFRAPPASEWDAAIEDGTLRITRDGGAVCTLRVRADDPSSLATAVSDDGRLAALAGASDPVLAEERVLLVDVQACRPVTIGSTEDPGPIPRRSERFGPSTLRFDGDALLEEQAFGTLRWDLRGSPLRLVPRPVVGHPDVSAVLDAGVPVLLGERELLGLGSTVATGDALTRPGVASTELGRETVVAGDELVTLGDDGWRRLSASGAVLASGPDLPLAGLSRAVRTAGALYVSDGYAWFDLTHGRSVLAPLVDRLAPAGHEGDRFAAVDVPDGVRVVGDGAALGTAIPARPSDAAVTADGRVLVGAEADAIGAREVATGRELWRVERPRGLSSLRAAARWVAVAAGSATRLLDPGSGSALATITAGPRVDGRAVPPDHAWDVPSAAWVAAAPAREPRRPTTLDRLAFAGDALVQALACGRSPGNLAPLAPLVPAVALAGCRSALHPARLPDDEARKRGVAWAWRLGADPSSRPLGDGLLVRTKDGIAAFGPDGALRWSRAPAGTSLVAALPGGKGAPVPVVVHAAEGRVALVAGDTGAERWSVPAAKLLALGSDADVVWVRRLASSPESAYSLTTGKPIPGARLAQHAFGWVCDGAGCVPEDQDLGLARGNEAAALRSRANPGPPPGALRLEAGLLLGPPSVASAPARGSAGDGAPTPSWSDASARFSVPAGPALAVVTEGGVVALGPDGRLRWRAEGRVDGRIDAAARLVGAKHLRADGWEDRACCVATGAADNRGRARFVGDGAEPGLPGDGGWETDGSGAIAGELVVIAGPSGTVAKRWSDRAEAWSRPDLPGGRLLPIPGAIVHAAAGWEVLDPRSGATLARGESPLLAVSSGPGPLRLAVQRADGRTSFLDASGAEIRVVSGKVYELVSDARGLTWVEDLGSRRLACSEVGPGWCVPVPRKDGAIAGDGERIYVAMERLVVAVEGDGEVAWAAPVEGVRGMFEVE